MEDSGSSPSGVTGEPVDYSMLHFTATYDDESTGSVIPSSCTPNPFGDTTGTIPVTFSFEGTDITVDVDYDVEAAQTLTVTSLSISGTPTGTQQASREVDFSGLTFTYGLSDGTSLSFSGSLYDSESNDNLAGASGDGIDGYLGSAAWKNNGLNKPVMTITVDNDSTDEYNYWFKHGYAVADPAPSATLDMTAGVDWSIDVSGTLTQTQYTGEQVDLTGLSFRADYVNGCYKGISIDPNMGEVSPRIWDDSGNPNNLGEQTATLSKTMDGVTKTATVTTVIHRPNDQELPMSSAGHVYFDYDPSWLGTIKAPSDLMADGGQIGDLVFLPFTKAAYEGGTTITLQDVMGAAAAYGTDWMTGTPHTGIDAAGASSSDYYVAWAVDGSGQASADGEFVMAVGTLTAPITGTGDLTLSFSSNMLASDPVVYNVTVTV